MKIGSFIAFIFFLNINLGFCQGGWNISYLEIDSLSEKHVGMEVRIDFRSKVDESNPEHSIRERLIPSNTEFLGINDKFGWFYEVRDIGIDYGYFEDQLLIEFNPRFGKMMLIRESWINEIKEDSVNLLINLEHYDISGSQISGFEKSEKINMTISKSILDGFLIRSDQ